MKFLILSSSFIACGILFSPILVGGSPTPLTRTSDGAHFVRHRDGIDHASAASLDLLHASRSIAMEEVLHVRTDAKVENVPEKSGTKKSGTTLTSNTFDLDGINALITLSQKNKEERDSQKRHMPFDDNHQGGHGRNKAARTSTEHPEGTIETADDADWTFVKNGGGDERSKTPSISSSLLNNHGE
ncbi:hypothetical protein H0H93_012397 [Arthromyces matolae]|nr:hypothetical protein H0H93_012397 [Arthromyces matolae]